MRCHVPIGRMISHPCGRTAKAKCAKCSKPACDKHAAGGTCVLCAGTYTPPRAPLQVTEDDFLKFTDAEMDAFAGPGAKGPRPGAQDS